MTYGGNKALIREWREAQFLTQRELAEKAGISRETVINAERGKAIELATVRKLATAFGIEPAQLFRQPEEGESK